MTARYASTRITTLLKKGLPSSTKQNNPHASVAHWLLGTAAVVGGIVHVGGVTRLTKSGLSMTDWKPFGSLPPRTTEAWEVEFERYKTFPEYQQRQSMDLEDFKFIYFWEWGHRMLGRTSGIVFGVPALHFLGRGMIPKGYGKRLLVLFGMGGGQGLVGWWMVKSGLGDDRRGDRSEIRVTPYRLAAHLSCAFATYSLLLWTGIDVLHYPNTARNNGTGSAVRELAQSMSTEMMNCAKKFRRGAAVVTGLTALTVVSGAFVAGNDAGNAYNTFPLMDDQWIPINDMIDPAIQPPYLNVFENTAAVQWNHRLLGCTTAASAISLSAIGMFHPAYRAILTPQVLRGTLAVGSIAVGQVSLGIMTLLQYVPISLAAAHQMGSLVLLSSGIYLVHGLRYAAPHMLRSASVLTAPQVVPKLGPAARRVGGMVMSPAKSGIYKV
mmetsp:Transcript_13364/g.15357  ORF Transcript_13364/g.15357 Transcript_13364/m.15357 type:complete len:438 (+) Transcript_13364:41-1354(+)